MVNLARNRAAYGRNDRLPSDCGTNADVNGVHRVTEFPTRSTTRTSHRPTVVPSLAPFRNSFARYCDASLSRTMGPLPDSDKLQRVVGYSLWTTTLPASLTTSGTGEPCRARSHCARLAHGARGLLQQNLTFEKNQRPDEVLGVCPENTRHVVAEVRSRLRLPGAHGFPS
jgi:hypothetical protein